MSHGFSDNAPSQARLWRSDDPSNRFHPYALNDSGDAQELIVRLFRKGSLSVAPIPHEWTIEMSGE
jgi:hypothetical protein